MIQDALAYAAQGLAVFPCTWITDGKCSCRDRLPSHWRNLGRRYFVAQKFLLGAPKMPITKGTAARSIAGVILCCSSRVTRLRFDSPIQMLNAVGDLRRIWTFLRHKTAFLSSRLVSQRRSKANLQEVMIDA